MSSPTQHWALLQAVAAKLQGEVGGKLTGVTTDSIRARKIATFNDYRAAAAVDPVIHALPGILVCYWATEAIDPATNIEDEKTWPVLIAFGSLDTGLEADDPYFGNRDAVAGLFVHQSFSTADPAVTYFNCKVEFGPILDPGLLQQKGITIGTIGLRFKQWKPRG